jgi:hypothetical protein
VIGSLSSSLRRAKALVSFHQSVLMKPILNPSQFDSIFYLNKDSIRQIKQINVHISNLIKILKIFHG